jgi:hypothetical protein
MVPARSRIGRIRPAGPERAPGRGRGLVDDPTMSRAARRSRWPLLHPISHGGRCLLVAEPSWALPSEWRLIRLRPGQSQSRFRKAGSRRAGGVRPLSSRPRIGGRRPPLARSEQTLTHLPPDRLAPHVHAGDSMNSLALGTRRSSVDPEKLALRQTTFPTTIPIFMPTRPSRLRIGTQSGRRGPARDGKRSLRSSPWRARPSDAACQFGKFGRSVWSSPRRWDGLG